MNGIQESQTLEGVPNAKVTTGTGKRKKLTHDMVKEAICYNKKTGVITWNKKMGKKRKGDIAGGLNKHLGYIMLKIYGNVVYAHRLAYFYVEGVFPKNIKIDHINRIKTDNRWKNLRLVSNECNARNCVIAKNNKSGVMGVSKIKSTGMWRSSILGGKDTKNLGHFINIEKAALARWNAEVEYNYPTCNTTSSAYLYLKDRGLI